MHERLERATAVAVARQRREHGEADVLGDVVSELLTARVAAEPGPGVAVGDEPDAFEQGFDLGLAPALGRPREAAQVGQRDAVPYS